MKYALSLLIGAPPFPPRPPATDATEDEKAAIRKGLADQGDLTPFN
jgi:hypothetical protein